MIGVVLYCYTLNDWEPRLVRQINRINTSGLYDGADILYLVISDVENNKRDIVDKILISFPKIQLVYLNVNHSEMPGISKVDDLCRNNDDCKVLYFHTKGVFNNFKLYETREVDELKVRGTNSWVEMMEYFLVDNWKSCVEKLDTYDTVGVTNNHNWWWGNFWWTKSSHIKKNIPIKDYYGGSRWTCEAWLHEANSEIYNIKYYEFYKFLYDAHYTVIPPYFYNGDNISNIEFDIIDAKYGYYSQQRDEGRAVQLNENLLIDITDVVKQCAKIEGDRIVLFENNKFDIQSTFVEKFGQTYWSSLNKTMRIRFKTNIDPENEYVISYVNNYYDLKKV